MKSIKIQRKFIDTCRKLFAIRGRWATIGSILLVLIITGTGGFYISQHKLNEQDSPKIVQAVQIKQIDSKQVVIIKRDNTQKITAQELVVYNTMHKMINTKIVAEDGKIWGEIEITTDKCNQLINDVSKSGYSDKTTLLQFLTRWKNKDFNSGVAEHNYLWNGLNGTIGKAKSLRQ